MMGPTSMMVQPTVSPVSNPGLTTLAGPAPEFNPTVNPFKDSDHLGNLSESQYHNDLSEKLGSIQDGQRVWNK